MPGVSVRNRTSEFQSIIENVRATKAPSSALAVSKRTRTKSDFSKLAASIGRDIRNTSLKLEKLTSLAQRRTLFDDPTEEIQDLTFMVKQDIATLNGKLDELSHMREVNTNKQVSDHTSNVVNQLKTKLMSTTQDFKEVLKTRTDSLQAQQDRRSQFLGATKPSPKMAPVEPRRRQIPGAPTASSGDSVAIDLGSDSLGAAERSTSGRRNNALSLSMMEARPDQGYQQARADAVQQVESTIVELGQIFNQLATMVAEQGEMVERIDANVEDAQMNVQAGHMQLMQYYNSLTSNRALILKVFATVLVFMFIWVLLV
mmetsp:Transcript_6550/g.27902  ORF Transcript_6550/g.27902 Transcript_6550/m.27902 type:complete len:315 (-) Transcript_6550:2702-3646(-)|eukprot:CAMPEP_0113962478 /NCGR_PEP_ID=MMETSP0011_2-20120614/5939_1 /TAXON_ID=101924 /ORGANISM="Rhodosorus marinus" /LENGTH=314 /DNA_ID=CAMNT_0000974339 /DNA_START=188 /DNA_END=1132 /DNA_ORIENTATION=- /assembly_acc=CAM_ASM_000156